MKMKPGWRKLRVVVELPTRDMYYNAKDLRFDVERLCSGLMGEILDGRLDRERGDYGRPTFKQYSRHIAATEMIEAPRSTAPLCSQLVGRTSDGKTIVITVQEQP